MLHIFNNRPYGYPFLPSSASEIRTCFDVAKLYRWKSKSFCKKLMENPPPPLKSI